MAPSYLSDHIHERSLINVSLRSRSKTPPLSRTEMYDNSFFPFCINKWKNLNDSIKALPSSTQFKKELSGFVRPKGTTYYGVRDNLGVKLLTKIRVSLSDLRVHRCNRNFNCASPRCSCGMDETPLHYFLCCSRYNTLRGTYLSKISEITGSGLPYDHLIQTIMYGSNAFNSVPNESIIKETILFIGKSGTWSF